MTKKLFVHLRKKIFAGILIMLPVGITFFILKLVFNTLDSIPAPFIPDISVHLFHRTFSIPYMGLIGLFFLLYLVGLITTNVLGRRLISWGDRLFANIPIVKNIYQSSKQLTDAFSATKKGSFRQAVFIEFPQTGIFTLCFVTNEVKNLAQEDRIIVFVPTAFVPPQGFVLLLPKEKVFPSGLTIEEAIKCIMSVGIVMPSSLPVSLGSASPEKIG